jgi:hypothetical protein
MDAKKAGKIRYISFNGHEDLRMREVPPQNGASKARGTRNRSLLSPVDVVRKRTKQ